MNDSFDPSNSAGAFDYVGSDIELGMNLDDA